MPSIRHDDVLLRLIKDMNDIRSALRRVVATLPLYDIDNENSPAQITANQNNYIPGNYDVLRLTSSAAYNITGIANGVKGRKLRIFNVGAYPITLVHASASSLAVNRFNFVNASDFIIPPYGNVLLYYDATQQRWVGGDQSSVYDVVNETTPAQITANQNNYDPGVAEVLRLSTDADRTITGISGGVKGRSLRIINVGNFIISLAHESGSSIAANRITSPTARDVVIYPSSSKYFYYDSTNQRWTTQFGLEINNRQGGSAVVWNAQGTTNYNLVAGAKLQVGVARITLAVAKVGTVTVTYPSAYTNAPIVLLTRPYLDFGAGQYVEDFGLNGVTNANFGIAIEFYANISITIDIHWMAIGV